MSIVLELQKEAMKSDKDILNVLRMALVVAVELDLNDFEEWIDKELNGYNEQDSIPNYRKITVIKSRITYFVNAFSSNYNDNKEKILIETNMTKPIHFLVDMISNGYDVYDIELPEEASSGYDIVVENSVIKNIIEQVNTKILRWVSLLKKNGITNPDFEFTQEEKDIAKTTPQIIQYITNNNIYGNNNNTQVQQNSDNSKQTIKTFDYDKVLETLLLIQNQSNDQKFITAFGDKTEEIKSIINETIEMVKQKDEPTKIKTCLNKLKDITQNVAGNLLATGIYNEILQLMKSLTSG